MIRKQVINSFDGTQHQLCETVRPEKYDDLLKDFKKPIIARGAGLSYCNAATTPNGIVVNMERMNRFLEFDPDSGLITVEAGMSIGELNNFLISHLRIFPVLPGYPSITIGGCVAFNIHGKSQFKTGTFGDWVRKIVIFHPVHGELHCSVDENPEVYDLTIGGMGLTGIIISVTLATKLLPGKKLEVTRKFVRSVYDAIPLMQSAEMDYEYVYSWNNLNLTGNSFGKGIVYLERYVQGELKLKDYQNKLGSPRQLPAVHTDFSVKLMCDVFYLLEKFKSGNTLVDLSSGCFPIYNKEIYYALFGKKGFREYQMLFPYSEWEPAFKEIEQLIKKKKTAIALGSLKLFNGKNHNLSFTGEGICLSIDVRNNDKSVSFFNDLDSICKKYMALVNISKDSRIDHELIISVYPGYELFKNKLKSFDPSNKIQSELKTRLNLDL